MSVLLRVISVAACRRSGSVALTTVVVGGGFARSISFWVVGRILSNASNNPYNRLSTPDAIQQWPPTARGRGRRADWL